MLLGIDLGTGSVKALLLDAAGAVVGEASRPYPVDAPRPGWAETAPAAWWQATCEAVREAVAGRGANVQALGLSGQMHGVVLTGEGGAPLRPAILWADTRSSAELEAYRALPPKLLRRLGNPLAVGMAGPTLLWLRSHEPAAYARASWALQPKDWLRLQLTGAAHADPSDASATLLYDLEADRWSFEITRALGLRHDWLPPILPSRTVAGSLSADAAQALELPAGLPVATGAGDAAASALGSGLLRGGEVQVNIGTAMQIFAIRDAPQIDPTLRTHLYRSALDNWFAMAAMQNAGIALEWVRRLLGLSWDEMYAAAFAAPPGADGLTFLPYLTGERTPHLDPDARGAWVGLTLAHERAHLARAAFEGVAFALRDGLIALQQVGIDAPLLRLAGGGTLEPRWRQLLADVLGKPLHATDVPAASARGAALLAGLAAGTLTLEQLPSLAPAPQPAAEPTTDAALQAAYAHAYARFRALYPALRQARPDGRTPPDGLTLPE